MCTLQVFRHTKLYQEKKRDCGLARENNLMPLTPPVWARPTFNQSGDVNMRHMFTCSPTRLVNISPGRVPSS